MRPAQVSAKDALDASLDGRASSHHEHTIAGLRLSLWGAIASVIFFAGLFASTTTESTGDTPVYVGQIIQYASGQRLPVSLWDFGHVVWRPLGLLLWNISKPVTASWYNGNPNLEITAALFAVNILAGFILTLALYAIARRLGLNAVLSFLATAGILLCSASISWVHSGSSYIPALALEFVGIWLVLRSFQEARFRKLSWVLAGAAFALAFCFWFPFVLSVPAALAAVAILPFPTGKQPETPMRERATGMLYVAVAMCAVAAIWFSIGAVESHATSLHGIEHWVANSSHGVKPQREYLRFPTGVTRSFLFMGDEGVTIKRFIFHDPYAHVGWTDLIAAGLWKVAVTFVLFCAIFWALLRIPNGRAALLLLALGIIPVMIFVIFLFEASGGEKYLPFYPALYLCVCEMVRQRHRIRIPVAVLIGFFVVMTVLNLTAYCYELPVSARRDSERVAFIHAHTQHGGVCFILSFRDPVSMYFQRLPFDPLNQPHALSLYHISDPLEGSYSNWKSDSACRALKAWKAGGEDWVSKRLVTPRPDPSWQWTEHDVPDLHWTDLYGFFSSLQADQDIGGPDGFRRIARTPRNEQILTSACHSATGSH